ncbi:hypothetical protein [Alicyclobacillus sp. SO9]|uniref:hypothetical protein n=1 Tax=Alicyclobacillus sp. SO9 TaxID=2665646 RepID=UPI0018E8801E|nr:hypothetical protein [Alicyclobacillus sp. SO9]QQE77704.1 hypothetical protein GI364_17450 [Alicyclobacillus sp. SO9]
MDTRFSAFIMDISGSRELSKANRLKIKQTLEALEETIHDWTHGVIPCKTDLRMGDELLVVAEHYHAAYILAYHIYSIWRGIAHPPYFGIAVGNTEETWGEIGDIRLWTHPVIAQAREASEILKSRRRHKPEMYLYHSVDDVSYELNYLLEVQHTLMSQQSQQQRWASLLYTYLRSQQEVSESLDISVPAVSGLISRGNYDVTEKTYDMIVRRLEKLECSDSGDKCNFEAQQLQRTRLVDNIQTHRRRKIQGAEEFVVETLLDLL